MKLTGYLHRGCTRFRLEASGDLGQRICRLVTLAVAVVVCGTVLAVVWKVVEVVGQ